jgi:hypothetical protein
MSITELENSMMTKKGKKKYMCQNKTISSGHVPVLPFFFHFQELGITDSGHET